LDQTQVKLTLISIINQIAGQLSQKKPTLSSLGLVVFLSLFLPSCTLLPNSKKATLTPAPVVFSKPTPAPLGSQENPLVMGFVNPQNDLAIISSGDALSNELSTNTLLATTAVYFPDYKALVDDLGQGKVNILWLPPATYLHAHDRGLATISLLSNHFGVYFYGTQFLANQASEFSRSFDPVTGTNRSTTEQSLAQFKDKRPCWVGPDSLSGYYVPLGILNENHIPVLPGAFLQNHSAVVRALYIRGICDFGVTFALLGDPRTASAVQTDLTDALDQIPVIYQTDGIIPNLGLAYSYNVPLKMQKNLDDFFLSVIKNDQNRGTLSTALDYEIQDLQKVDDSVYDQLRELLKAAGVDLQSLVGW
jgi:phosphonate transport system substrate-binding protein